MNNIQEIPIENFKSFKSALYQYADQKDYACFLDSNDYSLEQYADFDAIVGIGKKALFIHEEEENCFQALEGFLETYKEEWKLGYLSYDLKNDLEDLKSENKSSLPYPASSFFVPETLVLLKEQKAYLISDTEASEFAQQITISKQKSPEASTEKPVLVPSTSKEEYLSTIKKIKDHIIEGDIYEMNYCVEFTVDNLNIPAIELFQDLNNRAQAPFSAFLKMDNKYVLSVSPERYIKKKGNRIISQPIKGTGPRYEDKEKDEQEKIRLRNSEKDQAENVMIVDLVRNDLTKVSKTGSIKVDELFGIYSFKTVHQMISTVSSELDETYTALDVIKASFPMGSMTGAPKHRSMQLIEQYEKNKRGIYSGAIGYFSPENDFDFNVVIRSLLYDKDKKKGSFSVGGAIVYDSSPEGEYEECLLKAKALLDTLGLSV